MDRGWSMKIISLEGIKAVLLSLDLIPAIEAGFVSYSAGQTVVLIVGELLLDQGEVHIKYGYLTQDEYYVIKIASGFYDNPKIGLPSSSGLMLLFSQQTGELVSILLDEGYLTDTRTAVGRHCRKASRDQKRQPHRHCGNRHSGTPSARVLEAGD